MLRYSQTVSTETLFQLATLMFEIDLIYKYNLIPYCNGERGGR